MKEKITLSCWLELKPYSERVLTDDYYLKISEKVKKTIKINGLMPVLEAIINDEAIDLLCCFLTSYFEDLISGTNIWSTFTSVHKRLYQKELPFYVLDDYFENEINDQDVYFLIWYFLNSIQDERFIHPYNDNILNLGNCISEVFDDEWEYAPENEYLLSFYQIDESVEDYYIARKLIDTILFETYLFYPDTGLKLVDAEYEILESRKNDKNVPMYFNETRDSLLHASYTRLLAFKGKDWVCEMLDDGHLLKKEYKKITPKISGYFLYKGQNKDYISIEHIASGKHFKMSKESFDNHRLLRKINTIMYLGIVKWKREWWFSGIYFDLPYNEQIVLKEKSNYESLLTVSFLDENDKRALEVLKDQEKSFRDFNNGSSIAFMESSKIDEFLRANVEYYNNSLKLTPQEMEESHDRFKKYNFNNDKREKNDYSEIAESGLVFYNPKSGVEIALAVNNAFPAKNNPFFNIKKSVDGVKRLLLSNEYSGELTRYCIDNFKYDLPYFQEGIGHAYLDDMDFLLRFWKNENYHSSPSISLIS